MKYNSIFLIFIFLFSCKSIYEKKITEIKTYEEKNQGVDLKGWEYTNIKSELLKMSHWFYKYTKKKNAPVFLFLHGMSLDGKTFLNLKELGEYYNLYAYDFPEASSLYNGKLDDYIIIIKDFIKVMGFNEIYLGGISHGGVVAISLAANQKGFIVKELLLMSTLISGYTKNDRKKNVKRANFMKRLPDYKVYWLVEKLQKKARKRPKNHKGPHVSEILKIKKIDYYRQVFYSLVKYQGEEDAKKISCPVLVIHGDKDKVISLEKIKIIKKLIPQARVKIIKEGTHSMIYERGDEIGKLILDFQNAKK